MGRSALWGLLLGTTLMTALFLVGFAAPGDREGAQVVAGFIAATIMGTLFGGIPGTLIGVVVGAVRRRPPPVLPPPMPPPPVVLNDRWSAMVARCELSVRRVAAAVATVPASPAREWLERIAEQFGRELPDVRRIADLARALEADRAHPVGDRLAAAVRDFTAFEEQVGRVALQMFDQPSLERARVHLEVLEQQLPNLGER
ncbi:hypothetical protein [Saccharothrix syringae]|uniref:hypothetical protein n=1 Tax=Saccharothrix syringae TaxID=103733 RepID=UPI000AF7D870|nr:hypothetical protein [Saccharothrix syringae]